MPKYSWIGIDSNGNKISGCDYADNKLDLNANLRNKNILLIRARYELNIFFSKNNKIKPCYINYFIEQLALLINANVPIIHALKIIIKDEKNINLKGLIINIKNSILSGESFYSSLCKYSQYFDNILCNMINVGEYCGTLDIILNDLVIFYSKIAMQRRKMIKAIMYPAAVVIVAFFVTILLFLFVIPQFKSIYQDLGVALPCYTQFIISFGDFITQYFIYIILIIVIMFVSVKITYKKSYMFHKYLDELYLKLPFWGKILHYSFTARLARTIALSFKAGVPLLRAINIANNTVDNAKYKSAMQSIINLISNGKTFSDAMREQNLFSNKVIQLVSLGEESGKLDAMLEKIADIYNDELDKIIDNLNNLLEPIIMLVLGIIVGGLIIGMYLPIFRFGLVM